MAVINEFVALLPFEPSGRTACYITTASWNADWTKYEIDAIKDAGFQVKRINLAELSSNTVAKAFEGSDVIFVGGGNTFYLLQEVRRSGFDKLLGKKIQEGVPYVGVSAGAIILAPNIECVKYADDPAAAPNLTSFDGLNLFPLVPFVHFDNPDFKKYYRDILQYSQDNDVMFVTVKEKQFVFVESNKWRIIDSIENEGELVQ